MSLIIRDNIEMYMKDLRQWIRDTQDVELEEMAVFFTRRILNYEEHMSVWKKAYFRFAECIPKECTNLLDLGCGTGLELDALWRLNPDLEVTGIDLCQRMLDELLHKYKDAEIKENRLHVICADYFEYEFASNCWDAVISFESLHHFLPSQKMQLYAKIVKYLKPGETFILGDYIACCDEEEELLRSIYLDKRKRQQIQDTDFVHFDIPLTLEHEISLLQQAGFQNIKVLDSIEGATILTAGK